MDPLLAAGDIDHATWDPSRPALYLGSGRCAACFDAWGLMGGPGLAPAAARGPTALMHKDHVRRSAWGIDHWLPVVRLGWRTAPGAPQAWHQRLVLEQGLLRTAASAPGWSWQAEARFHPQDRDLLLLTIEVDGTLPDLLLVADPGSDPPRAAATVEDCLPAGARLVLRCAEAASAVVVRHQGPGPGLAAEGQGVRLTLAPGRHHLVVACGALARAGAVARAALAAIGDPAGWTAGADQAWARRWGAARLSLPVPALQALWARSLFWQFCGNAPEPSAGAPPCGLTGIAWSYAFPQDLSCIHPALLRSGHHDLVAGWVEHFRAHLPWQQEVTARLFRRAGDGAPAGGAMWAWQFPVAPHAEALLRGAPNPYHFQIHNAFYPARMAWDCARHRREPAWTEAVAWPVVEASARFFASVLVRGGDGRWGIHVLPSSGQDEYGGRDSPDYLCALYGARACLATALACAAAVGRAGDEQRRWRTILADGLAFPRLRAGNGLLATSAAAVDGNAFGRQKHPVQIHPLVFSPLPGAPDTDAVAAYGRADLICDRGAERPRFCWGWTTPAWWLAASRLGRGDDLAAMLSPAELAHLCDPAGQSFNELTADQVMWYFTTSHGLYQQAVQDACIDDSFGAVRVAGALPESWRGTAWRGLCTADGAVHEGRW